MADDKPKKGGGVSGGTPSGPLRQHQEYARTGKVPPGPPVTPKKPGP
jgi:hypothetical protein